MCVCVYIRIYACKAYLRIQCDPQIIREFVPKPSTNGQSLEFSRFILIGIIQGQVLGEMKLWDIDSLGM